MLFTRISTEFEILENGYVAVEDGIVSGVYSSLPEELKDAEIIDFGNRLLIPAPSDMHVHAPQFRNLGIAMDLELLPWLDNYTFPEETKFADTAYAEYVYRQFVRELWRYGTMRSAVFATVHTESTLLLMHLFEEAGMGAFVGKVAMNRNCPAELQESIGDTIAGYEKLIHEYSDSNGLVKPIITPRFVPSCTPELMQALGQLANKYQLPVQSHLSENHAEIQWVRELEPASRNYGDAYNRYGLFGQTPTVMAHCVWTAGDELELMQQNSVFVAHSPTSNLNLSSGMAPMRTFLDKGVHIGLASDISAGHTLNMFRVMVYAIEVSKMHYCNDKNKPFLTLSEAFYMATKSAGSFFGKVGSFEKGYEFDALVIDDTDLNFTLEALNLEYTLQQRLERFVYLGDDRHITHRFCRGKEIVIPETKP